MRDVRDEWLAVELDRQIGREGRDAANCQRELLGVLFGEENTRPQWTRWDQLSECNVTISN